ncbi:MAG: alanine racemase [Gammaproteobacteria bacterium]|nr:alanine racemase [Gammaproteobacteria bacterium]
MSRPTYVSIDLVALEHNLQLVKSLAPHRQIIAMVKANAYGHGVVRVAQALQKADALGVASYEEGMKLRETGIKQPIVLMEGLFDESELIDCVAQDFTLVVHHLEHIEILERAKLNRPVQVWLKINTGMHRLGVDPHLVEPLYARLNALPHIKKPIGLMTHFAEADLLDSSMTLQQINCFNQIANRYDVPKSLANSAAIIAWKEAHGDWVRPGLMLYGASPFPQKTGLDHGLKPVMTLTSRLIAITPVKKGGRVGYGGTWTAPEDLSIGVVGVGYGDGYPQFAQNGAPVLVRNIECPLVGRVSMDMLTVDLRHVPDAKVGDLVTLWGKGLPVERVAQASLTSAYEILTRMTPRPKIEVKALEINKEAIR